jgi:malonate decarboxylase gamma subunit
MSERGLIWLNSLTNEGSLITGFIPSVKVIDSEINGTKARFISVVKDAENAFVRAREGEVGLLEGWNIAKAVQEVVEKDVDSIYKTAIIAVVDVSSQAYGRREEAYGIHLALAAAVNAYAQARNAGHAIIALIVGKAMSGGLLAHGYQASRIIALNDDACMVHAMSKESAARVTMRSVEQLEALAEKIPAMAYDINNYNRLGLLSNLLDVSNADNPTLDDSTIVHQALADALQDIHNNGNDLSCRLDGEGRKATKNVRQLIQADW